MKNRYVDALSENFKRDYSINQLRKHLDQLEQSSSSSTGGMQKSLTDYADTVYGQIFSKDQLEKFDSISITKSNDSKFILTVVRELYAGKLESVKEKSATGRTKDPMSPEKCSALKEIFGNRLNNIEDSKERLARMSKLNKHINCAFANIRKSLQK